jgi:hypothetical protein
LTEYGFHGINKGKQIRQGGDEMKPLIRINRPATQMRTIAQTTAFYNPENVVTIYEMDNGGVISCELSHKWIEKWYEGDYRKETEFWPLSVGQYQEW